MSLTYCCHQKKLFNQPVEPMSRIPFMPLKVEEGKPWTECLSPNGRELFSAMHLASLLVPSSRTDRKKFLRRMKEKKKKILKEVKEEEKAKLNQSIKTPQRSSGFNGLANAFDAISVN